MFVNSDSCEQQLRENCKDGGEGADFFDVPVNVLQLLINE